MTIWFDRSRRADFEKCPRKRYWGYEYQGRGVQAVGTARSDWALMTGIGVHEGIGAIASGRFDVDIAVEYVKDKGYLSGDKWHITPDSDDKEKQAYAEQLALIEALVRCWAISFYPQFAAEYEVLAVEREEQVELAPDVVMMVRPDMVVRRRSDGALFTWQLKTTKRADEKWCSQWPLDQMTISEVLAVEERLQKERWDVGANVSDATSLHVSGVIVQGLVKSDQSEWPKGSGNWSFNSPLIYAWHNETGKPQPQGDWTARYAWQDEFGGHRLGKGWRKLAVWSEYPGGIAAWIAWLQQNDPVILQQQIVTIPPILRAPFEMERWKRATVHSEIMIRDYRLQTFVDSTANDDLFPMHTSSGNCIWPYRCNFYDICHGMASPDDETMFKPREYNHPQEATDAGE